MTIEEYVQPRHCRSNKDVMIVKVAIGQTRHQSQEEHRPTSPKMTAYL